MERHFDLLGVLYLAYGALLLLVALGVALLLGGIGAASGDADAFAAMGIASGTVGIVLGVFALAYLAAGWGLRNREGWARIAAMILGALALFSFPIGTALGIYTFWVLLKPEAQAAFS
jgi:hypothetical protein